jgi:hypothetical protein
LWVLCLSCLFSGCAVLLLMYLSLGSYLSHTLLSINVKKKRILNWKPIYNEEWNLDSRFSLILHTFVTVSPALCKKSVISSWNKHICFRPNSSSVRSDWTKLASWHFRYRQSPFTSICRTMIWSLSPAVGWFTVHVCKLMFILLILEFITVVINSVWVSDLCLHCVYYK